MSAAVAADGDVVFDESNGIGLITLNRPRARNALTTPMVLAMGEQLRAWEADPGVRAVLIRGAGDHGLCAGGDVKAMRTSAIERDGAVVEFFRAEYRLNGQISAFPKPYIALMDGITMGGGVGVSAHGSVRIVTERTAFAMPEVTIGIAPDIGATWLLSHAPGELGTYAGLTGSTLAAGDVIAFGLADHFVPSERLDELVAAHRGRRRGRRHRRRVRAVAGVGRRRASPLDRRVLRVRLGQPGSSRPSTPRPSPRPTMQRDSSARSRRPPWRSPSPRCVEPATCRA